MTNTRKVAFITGANRGLGYETARELGEAGIEVVLGTRDSESGEKAAASLRERGLKAQSIAFDTLHERDHTRVFDLISAQYGHLDILVNNAAVSLEGTASDLGPHNTTLTVSLEDLRKTYDVNFFSVIALTRTLLPLLRQAPAARIVNLSSILGSLTLQTDPNQPLVSEYKSLGYGSSKTALNAFTIYLAHALRDTPIKVNSAHPGWAKTGLGGSAATLEPDEGGKTSTALALLNHDGPSGGFFHLGEPVPW
ncbi:SDR family NAD(P)-dependent oxidoreductase [Granulicella sp. dw_53]|uniref:SDR family NAD(P)-dependent oxidoreductase n=1 Tax=Granulicella sp. dw_53 TaxID=2719792 RepID=UPI001BD4FE19|nr:SDR family NAD(P)-dependent oxidoreductase [Granulicella sp. dw_53]